MMRGQFKMLWQSVALRIRINHFHCKTVMIKIERSSKIIEMPHSNI